MEKKLKWISISEYVDNQTGEIISKSEYERNYIKIKTTKTHEINDKYGIRKFTHECEPNKQLRFEL